MDFDQNETNLIDCTHVSEQNILFASLIVVLEFCEGNWKRTVANHWG